MKLNVTVEMNLKTKEVSEEMTQKARETMRDVVVDIAREVANVHPWKTRTGNNSRSIMYESSGYVDNQESVVDQSKIEGAVYSTSGYGGYLETGTARMPAYPYFKPAADKFLPKFPDRLKSKLK